MAGDRLIPYLGPGPATAETWANPPRRTWPSASRSPRNPAAGNWSWPGR